MKKNSLEQIADILPEGLTEDLLNKIAELVNKKINEEVQGKVDELSIKVRAYLRGQIDRLKEQAIKELELENDTYRNAQLFETAKALFVTELSPEDEVTATNLMALEQENLDKKLSALSVELNKTLKENNEMRGLLRVLKGKVDKLEEEKKLVAQSLKESRAAKSMKLSDTAIVVSEENFKRKGMPQIKTQAPKQDSGETSGNVFLNEEVLSLMN